MLEVDLCEACQQETAAADRRQVLARMRSLSEVTLEVLEDDLRRGGAPVDPGTVVPFPTITRPNHRGAGSHRPSTFPPVEVTRLR